MNGIKYIEYKSISVGNGDLRESRINSLLKKGDNSRNQRTAFSNSSHLYLIDYWKKESFCKWQKSAFFWYKQKNKLKKCLNYCFFAIRHIHRGDCFLSKIQHNSVWAECFCKNKILSAIISDSSNCPILPLSHLPMCSKRI